MILENQFALTTLSVQQKPLVSFKPAVGDVCSLRTLRKDTFSDSAKVTQTESAAACFCSVETSLPSIRLHDIGRASGMGRLAEKMLFGGD